MKKSLVSIITPVYNSEKFIGKTIESVINQSYPDWEHILVDDCSTDFSAELIRDFSNMDSRVKYVALESNQGAAVARNKGLEVAKGQYIAFIDSDDTWKPDKLMKQVEFMRMNQYFFSYTNFSLVSEEGEQLKQSVPLPNSLDYFGLLKNTAIACSTVMIDREVVGDFRMPLVRKGQDTATWLQILKKYGKAYCLNEVLTEYRQVKGSISSNRFGALARTWNTYYRIENLPFLKAMYYFIFYVFNAIRRRA